MKINLRDINEENWLQCIGLTTDKSDQHFVFEEFIPSNTLSLAQSKIENGWITKGIYDKDKIIGFTMYGYCYEDNFYELCRLMIHHAYQGRGYGKEAIKIIIEEMKKLEGCKEIFLSFYPENIKAKNLYENVGFKNTGEIINGELIYSLKLKE